MLSKEVSDFLRELWAKGTEGDEQDGNEEEDSNDDDSDKEEENTKKG